MCPWRPRLDDWPTLHLRRLQSQSRGLTAPLRRALGKKVSLTDGIYCLEGDWNKRRVWWNSGVQMWKEAAELRRASGSRGGASVNLDCCLAWFLMNLRANELNEALSVSQSPSTHTQTHAQTWHQRHTRYSARKELWRSELDHVAMLFAVISV